MNDYVEKHFYWSDWLADSRNNILKTRNKTLRFNYIAIMSQI